MKGFARSWGLALALPVAVAVFVGCSSQFTPVNGGVGSPPPAPQSPQTSFVKPPTNGLVQSSEGGAVEIDVKWQGERNGILTFEVVMDTHSVDLDQYDLGKLAGLRDDGGAEYRPASWRSAPGGHHRSGTLTFPVPGSLSEGKAKYVEMIIRDVADVKERVLKWTLE
ncbi:MAG: hypothetical protein Q8P00_05275 [Dehalococcoidia bacterium]|nr:hypothetical protein [Dehalococcoidia bacterium]